MNTTKLPSLSCFLLPLIAFVTTVIAADDGAATALQEQAIGFWAPAEDAMLKVFTEENGMKKEDALAALAESKDLTFHIEQGSVSLYTRQGVVAVPYEILAADAAGKSLTLRQANAPEGANPRNVRVTVTGDKITVLDGMAPFILQRIDQEEFNERKAALPAKKVGP